MHHGLLKLVVAVILFIAVANIFFGISRVESESMVPTLSDGDWLMYVRFTKPKRFGIFFIDDPKNENRKLVKRIIGLPGEKIGNNYVSYIIPPNHFYVLGDHKGEYWGNNLGETVIPLDSRNFGPVNRANIHERAVLVFWPLKHARWLL